MELNPAGASPRSDSAALVMELEQAEAYEQKLRQMILDVRDQLAAGHTAMALSMLNGVLSFMDDATDVVAPHPHAKE